MCKLSYEKCVCFILLVIVAFLSCSGFRIDKLAMTDISKRNSHTSSSSDLRSSEFLARLFGVSENSRFKRTPYDATPETSTTRNVLLSRRTLRRPHRIRHARKQRVPKTAQAAHNREPQPRGWIDTFVFTPNEEFTDRERNQTSPTTQELPQNSPIGAAPVIVNRSQRSPGKKRPKKKQQQPCQEQDVATKAYLANTVVLGKPESMSSHRRSNVEYSVTFRIRKSYKSIDPIEGETIRLKFSYDKRPSCESENQTDLVKINIKQTKMYILFLKNDGQHNYSVLGTPVLFKDKKKQEESIRRACKKDFAPKLKQPRIVIKKEDNSTLKLQCTAVGNPIPLISWQFNGTNLRTEKSKTRITFVRRNSTLHIKNSPEKYSGRYNCTTKSADGKETSAYIDISQFNSENHYGPQCNETYKHTFCQNGGRCFKEESLGEMSCVCEEGYAGERCEQKTSTYIKKTYTCKLGLSTTYYC